MGAHLVMGAVQGPGAMVPQVHDGASLAAVASSSGNLWSSVAAVALWSPNVVR